MPEPKNRMNVMIDQVVTLKNYLAEQPGQTEKQLMEALGLKKTTLYRLLSNLANDPLICVDGKFPVQVRGRQLSLKVIDNYLNDVDKNKAVGPKPAERLLYLYINLHNSIPFGGLSMEAIERGYRELIEQSGGKDPSDAALKRMIYRDLVELEGIGISIKRPSTGSPKYCLTERYLPKLSPDSAATVYVSMLLYENTLLDKATTCAKNEIEKTFFKNAGLKAGLFSERIYVVGDTLSRPEEFGDTLGKLIRAVIEGFEQKICYAKVSGEVSERIIRPMGMVCKHNVWYVIAYAPERKDYRTFRVDQIMSIVNYENNTFKYPEDFNIIEHIGDSWGVYCDDPVRKVRLKFSRAVANRVKNLRYHHSQEIIEEGQDGTLIVEFEACGFKELRTWILQWGPEVEVLEPLDLREQVRERAWQVVRLYDRRRKKA
ncbi:MAG TPA: WYL domain-containing protein [Gelria sp.]|nr:WYL domain-containing protein [Gelria sp.]